MGKTLQIGCSVEPANLRAGGGFSRDGLIGFTPGDVDGVHGHAHYEVSEIDRRLLLGRQAGVDAVALWLARFHRARGATDGQRSDEGKAEGDGGFHSRWTESSSEIWLTGGLLR